MEDKSSSSAGQKNEEKGLVFDRVETLAEFFGYDPSKFKREEWIEARRYIPGIDYYPVSIQRHILTLVRTAKVANKPQSFVKRTLQLIISFNFGVMFNTAIEVKAMFSYSEQRIVFNRTCDDSVINHEILRYIDQCAQ